MKFNLININKSLSKAYLKQDLNRIQIETLQSNLKTYFTKIDAAEKKKEHEEHFKNIVADFLKDTYYKNEYEVNINKRKDLVIHNGNSSSDLIGVIIEAKRPSNDSEMISVLHPNAKALWELVHYYMEERIAGNTEIKHLIATSCYDWYLFDASDFEEHFYGNKKFRKTYIEWSTKVLAGSKTDWFYSEIAKPFIETESKEFQVVHINLNEIKNTIHKSELLSDEKLIDLYKILSPQHLLKRAFSNDSNTLNKQFYHELLHLIGLEEKSEGGKKIILRKQKNRSDGSLLENTINILNTRRRLNSIENIQQYGDSDEEQIYSIGLELCITWLNRILFLKLLEGQLIKYHKGNPSYSFLNSKVIKDFDELDELFFEVLAVNQKDRSKTVSDKFGNIPYLNSSLFEISDIESKTIQISEIKDRLELDLYSLSVLKNKSEYKSIAQKNTLHYLFEFLDAYNFSSDSSAKIQEDNKTIINASVLGLIFEKINGYKDGSFFTPGFITMYMCKETIRRGVAQKFKDNEDESIETFDDVKFYCARFFKKEDISRFNNHINSLKICDPAVGSGHFLVSALNEIISIKSDLNILCDSDFIPLEYEISVDNDELIIINKKTNQPFEYILGDDNKPPKSLQQTQVALFEEKKKIIENCLFGVDINPKSVLICRLRLWIELLKHAYYKPNDYSELETLPNIDINIKRGNSLISRFSISENHLSLSASSQQKLKYATEKYKEQVFLYKATNDKTTKQNAEKEISRLKEQFSQMANPNDEDYINLQAKKGELGSMPLIFDQEDKDRWVAKTEELNEEIIILENEYNDKLKTLYANTLEWRFEFPEILDDDGNFKGFDIIIGNPPYVRQEGITHIKSYLQSRYKVFDGRADLYTYFYELSISILHKNSLICLITPNKFLRAKYGLGLKKFISREVTVTNIIDFGELPVFEEASTFPMIFIAIKNPKASLNVQYSTLKVLKAVKENISLAIESNANLIERSNLNEDSWNLASPEGSEIIDKINLNSVLIKDRNDLKIYSGIKTGFNDAFWIDGATRKNLIEEDLSSAEIIKPLCRGTDIRKWQLTNKDLYIIYTHQGTEMERYPAVVKYLSQFKDKLEKRAVKQPWWQLQQPQNRGGIWEGVKILYPDICKESRFCLDEKGVYSDMKGFVLNTDSRPILAILNSKLIWWYLKQICAVLGDPDKGGRLQLKSQYIERIPIPLSIDEFTSNRLERLVDQCILNPKDCEKQEDEINELIYEIYGLSEEDIKIIES